MTDSGKKFRSLSVNAALNAFKSALGILFPLITYPYAFRILHTEGIGKVNYATSIISYFTLIAGLGISTYATREGAKLRDNKKKLQKFCSQMFSFNLITTAFSYIILFLFIVFFKPFANYKTLLLILSLNIAFTTLGVEWINTIFEDYLYITLRSIASYIVTLILLFVWVRTADDYPQYAFLTVLTNGIICFSNLFYCRRYVHIHLTLHLHLKKHLKPILTFFANTVATTIYVSSDTTMLGFMAGDHFVGLYSLAVKVYNVIKSMLAAMYSVAIPRLSYYVGQNDLRSVKSIYTSIIAKLTVVLLPAGVGLAAVSREIVLVMGGSEYLDSVLTLQILAISLIGAVFGGSITYCLNIPLGKERINAQATALSALINIGLNLFMIPLFKQNGAAITTVIAEYFVLIYCLLKTDGISNYIDGKYWLENFGQALIGCVSIVGITVLVKKFLTNTIIRLGLIVLISIVVYAIELLLFKNDTAVQAVNKIKGKIHK